MYWTDWQWFLSGQGLHPYICDLATVCTRSLNIVSNLGSNKKLLKRPSYPLDSWHESWKRKLQLPCTRVYRDDWCASASFTFSFPQMAEKGVCSLAMCLPNYSDKALCAWKTFFVIKPTLRQLSLSSSNSRVFPVKTGEHVKIPVQNQVQSVMLLATSEKGA